jgi:hypothetical protein
MFVILPEINVTFHPSYHNITYERNDQELGTAESNLTLNEVNTAVCHWSEMCKIGT